MRTPENGWSVEEAGMAQLDDIVGSVMQKLKDMGVDNNTILTFSTDNGAENFTWPDGGQTPFAGGKGTGFEGGFRVPMIIRWPGKVPTGAVENSIVSGLDWFPTFVAAAGNPNIADELKAGKQIGDRNYRVHLDGYDQMDLITGKGPSKRHDIFYFTETTLAAVRIDDYKYRFTDQPNGWLGSTVKVDLPILTNLRLDPYERSLYGCTASAGAELGYWNAGTDDIDAVELGFSGDLIDLARKSEATVADIESEVLGHLLRIHDFTDRQADLDGGAQLRAFAMNLSCAQVLVRLPKEAHRACGHALGQGRGCGTRSAARAESQAS
jgi:hypothetical protein